MFHLNNSSAKMNTEKMSSDEVPQNFAEWLLAMGAPPDIIPPPEKLTQMCRGQYYMVWRSMMERVEPKDSVHEKRMQVFCNDITRCQRANSDDTNILVPLELKVWREQQALKHKVELAEAKVSCLQDELTERMDKAAAKISERDECAAAVACSRRRAWLLAAAAAAARARLAQLRHTHALAVGVAGPRRGGDAENLVDQCLATMARGAAGGAGGGAWGGAGGAGGAGARRDASLCAPVASSSILSTAGDKADNEEALAAAAGAGAAGVWAALLARRCRLPPLLAAAAAALAPAPPRTRSAASASARTASLHAALSLRALKQRARRADASRRIAAAVAALHDDLDPTACEHLVVRCERASGAARLQTLEEELRRLAAGAEPYGGGGGADAAPEGLRGAVAKVDRAISEAAAAVRAARAAAAAVARRTRAAKTRLGDALLALRASGEGEGDAPEPAAALRGFYAARRARPELSLPPDSLGDLDTSAENTEPTFTDELKLYLKTFKLERNRKLVLESGDKIWCFESLAASASRLRAEWGALGGALGGAGGAGVAHGLRALQAALRSRDRLADCVAALEGRGRTSDEVVDINKYKTQEETRANALQLKLNSNVVLLTKINKTIQLGVEDVTFWQSNVLREYVSTKRTVGGKEYAHYESAYLHCLNTVV